ncbi:MAG: hypothetical protein ACKOI0_05145 [Actinomycetota bacterium]
MNRRLLVAILGVVAVVALFLVLRPSDAGSPAPAPTGGQPSPTDVGLSPEPVPTVFEVTVAGGEVAGVGNREVRQGTEVVIRVTSDVTDEVHVHGYDLHADVAPGVPGEVAFVASAPGVFEVELEDAGMLLLTLTVTP